MKRDIGTRNMLKVKTSLLQKSNRRATHEMLMLCCPPGSL